MPALAHPALRSLERLEARRYMLQNQAEIDETRQALARLPKQPTLTLKRQLLAPTHSRADL